MVLLDALPSAQAPGYFQQGISMCEDHCFHAGVWKKLRVPQPLEMVAEQEAVHARECGQILCSLQCRFSAIPAASF
jgi:hypothetical protein